MTKLEQLIEQLCPDGVEYKEFGEIATISRGASPRPIKAFLTNRENGVHWIKIGDVKSGKKYIESTEEFITVEGAKKSRAVKKGDFILSNSMSFGRPYILRIDGYIHDGWLSISGFEQSLLSDFLYFVLNSTPIQAEMRKRASFGGAVQNLNADIVRRLSLPVPPLEVQAEIVRILDTFTELTTELTTKLTTELTNRKKQYEYYRNQLLNIRVNNSINVNKCKLNEIASVYDGTHQTPEYKENGIPFISVENIGNIYSNTKFISPEAYSVYKAKPIVGDVFMTRIGSIGKCSIMTQQVDLAYYVSLALIRPDKNILDSRYLKHYIESSLGSKELAKRTLHHAVPIKINKDDIGKISISYPSLSIQKRIADVLDNFEAICSDLNIGLPAEIEARQKQYEYYRDLLLTFAETGGKLPEKRREEKRREEKRREES